MGESYDMITTAGNQLQSKYWFLWELELLHSLSKFHFYMKYGSFELLYKLNHVKGKYLKLFCFNNVVWIKSCIYIIRWMIKLIN